MKRIVNSMSKGGSMLWQVDQIPQKMKSSMTTWKMPPVHPAAQRLPMMSETEIKELAADIKANGLVDPVIIWVDNREAANGSEGPFPEWFLDGRGRLEALKLLGITDPREAHCAGMKKHDGVRKVHALMPTILLGSSHYDWVTDTDPDLYVLSTNVRRRHLTSEQKRDAIAAFIKVMPQASDRKIAETLNVSPTTVGDVRSENVQLGHNPNYPLERAKAAVRENPTLSSLALSKVANVSDKTVAKARRELITAGEILSVTQQKARELVFVPGQERPVLLGGRPLPVMNGRIRTDSPKTFDIPNRRQVESHLASACEFARRAGMSGDELLERLRALVLECKLN